MTNYELMFIINPTLEEEKKNAVVEKVTEIITNGGGEVSKTEVWGMRKLAYPINYENEGNYVLWNFTSECSFPAELERVFGITDGVLRFLIMKR